jgi:hypothetical protein
VGGARLRGGALSDPKVIERVNERTVPVWVDVRRSAYPDLPALKTAREDLNIDSDGRLSGFPSYWFHVRSFLITPDGERLLNPEEGSREFPSTKPERFLEMLDVALNRATRRSAAPKRDAHSQSPGSSVFFCGLPASITLPIAARSPVKAE